ncbi:PKD domain-containing protein, partial [Arthrospira platensis SPKY1]|nr:PKD domain-containing protein [Arthrospira platensis SPKY1]
MPTTVNRGIPNFPDYRLGPLDGSPCDTLGMDNHPVAKFRYEADTLDHLRLRFTDLSYFRPEAWSWDFGDGSPASAVRYPQHLYTKSGTYEVCLTVSNENSSDNNCRTVTIGGTNSTDETAPAV